MQNIIELQNVAKSYGNTIALQLNRLAIGEGELYLLAGPNGSGKSTLLNILGFLTRPDRGDLLFSGERVDWKRGTMTRLRRQVTLLHQSPYLFRGNVYDNVAYGLSLRGMGGVKAREVVSEALATVGLDGFQLRKHTELSGGEAQRVAMARALALRPKLLLLDEPLANVDQKSARVLEEVIAALPSMGTTVVMSSHDPDQQQRLPCKPIRLQGGRLAAPAMEEERTFLRHLLPLPALQV
ncbi:ATP-binding cassette domain-containing protein [Geotalea toluenoxydans]|uniref:ATP-binding cassette domain-containing protein n=1 Tax=Geotalea toluenoxydans TaxID=421624 RepID=UPI0006CF7B74|nr:ATP-binding cassette domain-containing protein [Geotalea toluenoxydans]